MTVFEEYVALNDTTSSNTASMPTRQEGLSRGSSHATLKVRNSATHRTLEATTSTATKRKNKRKNNPEEECNRDTKGGKAQSSEKGSSTPKSILRRQQQHQASATSLTHPSDDPGDDNDDDNDDREQETNNNRRSLTRQSSTYGTKTEFERTDFHVMPLWKKYSVWCGMLVNHEKTQLAVIVLIVLNAIMMGIGTFDFVEESEQWTVTFETVDTIFLVLFTIELVMQFIYRGVELFMDGWLFFDFIIVVMSWSLESMQIVRAFRIFRAFRLITRLTILRNLVQSIFAVAPSMGAIIALLLLIMYIYAVMCTVLFAEDDPQYFGRLDKTFFTLFSMMTLEWAAIVRNLMVTHFYFAWGIFSSFLVLTSFILYSLMIAVVCDAVNVTEHSDEDDAEQRREERNRNRIVELRSQVQELAAQQENILSAVSEALTKMEEKGNSLRRRNQRQQRRQQQQQQQQIGMDLESHEQHGDVLTAAAAEQQVSSAPATTATSNPSTSSSSSRPNLPPRDPTSTFVSSSWQL